MKHINRHEKAMQISYTRKQIKNLGNYENLTIEVSVQDEVNFDIENKDDCYDRLSDFVSSKISAELDSCGEPITYTDDFLITEAKKALGSSDEAANGIKTYLSELGAKKVSELSQGNRIKFINYLKRYV